MRAQLPEYLAKVLRLLAQGHQRKAIAFQLGYSEDTVNEYVKRLKNRLYNEPELRSGQYKTETALVLIGRRYFELDVTERSGSYTEDRSTADFIERHADAANLIYQMRIRGDAPLAVREAERVVYWIERKLNQTADETHRHALLRICGVALFEMGSAQQELHLPADIPRYIRPIVDKLRSIHRQLKDVEFLGLASLLEGDTYYISGKHELSIPLLTTAVETLKTVDHQLWALRVMALSFAHRQYADRVTEIEHMARRSIDRGVASDEQVCHTCEGLARAHSLLNRPPPQVLELLENGRDAYQQIVHSGQRAPIRAVQLFGRTTLDVLEHLGETDNELWANARQEASKMQIWANAYSLLRHEWMIRNRLEK
jgi:hypothetical protein